MNENFIRDFGSLQYLGWGFELVYMDVKVKDEFRRLEIWDFGFFISVEFWLFSFGFL